MLSRFKKQSSDKWSELIHDGPRVEITSKESMTLIFRRQKFPLHEDIAKFIKDYFRLKTHQQEDFKEKFIEGLRARINKIYPGNSVASLELDECSFVEHETTAPTSKEVAETTHHDPTIILDGKLYKHTFSYLQKT
jgi:hypothetical protein